MAAPRPNTYSKAGGVRRRQPEPLRRQRTKISSAHNARGSASRAKAERFSTSRSERPSAVSWPLSPSQSSKNESRGLQREKRALHSEHARRLSFLKASSHWRTESGKCGPREEWPAVPGSDRIRAYLGGWFRHYPLGCYRSAAQFTGSTELLFLSPGVQSIKPEVHWKAYLRTETSQEVGRAFQMEPSLRNRPDACRRLSFLLFMPIRWTSRVQVEDLSPSYPHAFHGLRSSTFMPQISTGRQK